MARVSGILLLAMASLTAVSCASVVGAWHEPMHPQSTERVTFHARAVGRIDRIELSYERFTVGMDAGGARTRTLAEGRTTVKTCNPAGIADDLSCDHTMANAFPSRSLVTYFATSIDGDGSSATETYSFATADYPWPNEAIPIRVTGATTPRLDIVFVRDTDLSLADLRAQLDETVLAYLKNDTIRPFRQLHNFYYSTEAGDYRDSCMFTPPPNMAQLALVGDQIALLFRGRERACQTGNMFSTRLGEEKTLVHEAGHGLFGLSDEYCCDGGYWQDCLPNLYSSLANCQADAARVGLPASNCTQLIEESSRIVGGPLMRIPFWRIDSRSPPCLMRDNYAGDAQFGRACTLRINWRYGRCIGGNCFPSTCP